MDFLNKSTEVALAYGQKVAASTQGSNKIGKARPGELRLIAPLSPNQSEYILSVDDGKYENYEAIARGLKYRNGFAANGIAIGVLSVKVNAAGDLMWGSETVHYHIDANYFDEAAADAVNGFSEAEALNCIYTTGLLNVKTNEGVRIEKFPTRRFRTVHTTQHSATTVNESLNHEIKSLGGVLNFKGGDENEISLRFNCVDKTLIAGTATRKNFLVIDLVGSEIKGDTTSRLS